MKHRHVWISAVGMLLLSALLLSGSMLHIFAGDLPAYPLPTEPFAPTGTTAQGDSAPQDDPTDGDIVLRDDSQPIPKQELDATFGVYTHVTEENGKQVVTVFSEEQIAAINARRDAGETMLLCGQEMLYLLDDTKRLFETYDIVRIRDLDGTLYTFPGLRFYTSAEFDAAFSTAVGEVENSYTYDLKRDAYEAMIYRIHVLHSYAEYIRYQPDVACMYVYTAWDGFKGEDPRVLAEGLLTRHASYSARFTVAKNYADGDRGDDNGAHPEIPQLRLNYIRSTPGGMLTFYGEEIFYIADLSAFDGTNMLTLYPDGIFPGGTVTGKYENGQGKAVVIELWEEASASCIARIRLTEQANPTEVEKIAALWNGMKDIRTRGNVSIGSVGYGSYRVAVYLCGFPHEMLEGGSEQGCFWYKPEANTDLWSHIWWDDVTLDFSDNYIGGAEMTAYINSLLKQLLIQP